MKVEKENMVSLIQAVRASVRTPAQGGSSACSLPGILGSSIPVVLGFLAKAMAANSTVRRLWM